MANTATSSATKSTKEAASATNQADDMVTMEFPVTPNFSPEIPIEILGMGNSSAKVVAVVDTGYTGFLNIPLTVALQCKLTLWSTSSSRLADGRVVKNLDCIGSVRIGEKVITDVINLTDTGNDCLLGMQFLQRLGGTFTVDVDKKKAIFAFPKQEETNG